MRTMIGFLAVLFSGLLLAACTAKTGDEAGPVRESAKEERTTVPRTGEQIAEVSPGEGVLSLGREGKVFDPPVKAEVIPEGAWFCDMGTVHYARPDKGDGRCPVCGMFLREKGAEESPEDSES